MSLSGFSALTQCVNHESHLRLNRRFLAPIVLPNRLSSKPMSVPSLLPAETAEEHCERGIAFIEEDDYEQAVTEFSKAIELDSDYAEAYYNRGNAYYDLGQYCHEKARRQDILRLWPSLMF